MSRSFKRSLEVKRRAAHAKRLAREDAREDTLSALLEEAAEPKVPTMTSEEIAAELQRLDAEEKWEAERPAREAAARKARVEAEQERIAKARRDISQRWILDPVTKQSELKKFDRKLRRKGR
jgi:hypothetical protein